MEDFLVEREKKWLQNNPECKCGTEWKVDNIDDLLAKKYNIMERVRFFCHQCKWMIHISETNEAIVLVFDFVTFSWKRTDYKSVEIQKNKFPGPYGR